MIGNDGISDIAGAKSVGLDTFYIHSNISPKLPEETVILPDGTEKKTEDRAGCRLCVRWNGHGASQGAAAGRMKRRLSSADYLPSTVHNFFTKY